MELGENWEDNPDSLTIEQALEIMEYKKKSTYRMLTRKFLGYENQWEGERLACTAAMKITGMTVRQLYDLDFDPNDDFCKQHQHILGEFFWWL